MQSTQTPAPGGFAIGVDTGGTHTDLVLAGNGRVTTLKVPSTPADLTLGIIDGIQRIVELAGVPLAAVDHFVYGSTYVTNLFIEQKESGVGLITTAGFRDVLEIGRASRKPDVYDIHWRPARPFVARHLRCGVPERVDHLGQVVTPLDEEAARQALRELAAAGVQSIAVCLLHAYANPAHERRIAELAAEVCPQVDVSLSSEVVREFREFERTSTTCVNAFIRGPITRHLRGLQEALAGQGVPAKPFIMRGNGGISTFDSATRAPTAITHSGVMGGIIGANALAASCGIANLITLDMGGTSADVSLISNGAPLLTSRSRIGPYPLLAPTLDMVTIGAGGGSIAWVEGGFGLRVGPRSAGSVPGPACYGQGGRDPTVTDANLVAGRLNGDFFLGGARHLDLQLARAAIVDQIAKPLGMVPEEAALGIIAIVEAHMADAIRLVSVERGLDPRDFTLVAFGGAGALHAVRLADALSIRTVLIPPAPGNLSAMGLLSADVRHDHARTLVARLVPELLPQVTAMYAELLAEAEAALVADGVDPAARRYTLSADVRYGGQNYELTLPILDGELDQGFDGLVQRFNDQHLRVYGYNLNGREVQLVNVRVTAYGAIPPASWPERPAADAPPQPAGRRTLLVEAGVWVEALVYRFDDLRAGHAIAGPAVVEYSGSTLFLPPGWNARFDAMMNAHVSRAPQPAAAAEAQASSLEEPA
ncbi:MAG: hydantoinase/oxoprolinase family protein [Burkholderiales bacterium]|nr:hydantoinase/oxoprolinase family protein [Burkholderiales bacterium]